MEQDDWLREGVRVLAQALMEMELEQHLGADVTSARVRSGYRNGTRERTWDTRVGTIELQVPRVRDGSFFPSLLEPRRRAERALVAVVQEAYVLGVQRAEWTTWSKPSACRASARARSVDCAANWTRRSSAFGAQLDAGYPYVWLDGTFVKGAMAGRVVSQAIVVAIGVTATGNVKCSGWTWDRPKVARSGWRFCGAWSAVD